MSNFNKRLMQLQSEKKLLKKDVAAAIGVTYRHYQRYESGESEPALSVLVALADYFDVSLDYLTGRSDNPSSHKS